MKSIVIVLFLMFNCVFVSGQDLKKEELKVVVHFIDCIKNQKKEALAAAISFPFKREYPLADIKNKKEFLKRYNQVFDENLIKMIVNSKPATDWSAVGWRGIMLFNGALWLDYDGRLISVNYQSKYEQRKLSELIQLEKKSLNQSIIQFKSPVHILETSKFRIRIDDLGNGNYRYTSWPLKSKMMEKPDIIIENGVYSPDGSGGNHSFIFKNKDYTYECAIVVMAENDAPPAYLIISKDDKEILSQKAVIVTK